MARIPAADPHPDIDASDPSLRGPAASKCGTDLACSVLTRRGASRAWTGSRTDRPQWTAAGLQSFPGGRGHVTRACMHARNLPRALTPATAASGLPRNHLLAPTAGVGSCRPPTTRQNANSCEEGVGLVGNFLRGNVSQLVILCPCGRTRRERIHRGRRLTRTRGHRSGDPRGDSVADRCPGGRPAGQTGTAPVRRSRGQPSARPAHTIQRGLAAKGPC